MDILAKLADLHKQATTERSHYYVAGLAKQAKGEVFSASDGGGAAEWKLKTEGDVNKRAPWKKTACWP